MLRLLPDELDAERFLAAVAQGRELRDRDPEAADEILADAMRLWRGVPFADLAEPPPEVREHARYLERQQLEALETWFDVRLQLGRHHELVPELSELVEQHPYDEALHAQLVLALYRCGRQAEAPDRPRASGCGCAKSLGSMPPPRSAISTTTSCCRLPRLSLSLPSRQSNLPRRLTSFVGKRAWAPGGDGAPPGESAPDPDRPRRDRRNSSGARGGPAVRAQFPGGVWWIDLASVTDPAFVLDEVARTLGVSVTTGTGSATPSCGRSAAAERCSCWTTASTWRLRSRRRRNGS